MREFGDAGGSVWVATAREENTPRHHGRWYLVLHPADDVSRIYAVPEVRWQTRQTAARTLTTMSEFELQRRLETAVARAAVPVGAPARLSPGGGIRDARPGGSVRESDRSAG